MSGESSNHYTGRLIIDCARVGAFNMAADSYLAREAKDRSEPILRLYTWDVPTLSLGYHQRINDRVTRRCSESGIPIVRRPTGGRAVVHDNELTYCLTIPTDHPIFTVRKNELLQSIGSIFVEAAKNIGLNAAVKRATEHGDIKPESPRKGSPLCFDAISRWEVRLGGEKWIGSAQRILPGVLLQHGSILLGESRVDIGQLFNLTLKGKAAQSVSYRDLKQRDLVQSIPVVFSENWGIDWREQLLTPKEVDDISCMAELYMYQDEGKLCKDSLSR